MILIYNASVINTSDDGIFTLLLSGDDFTDMNEYSVLDLKKQDSFIKEEKLSSMQKGISKIIDFKGDYLLPSFIDAHCHSDFFYMKNPKSDLRRNDFISTEIAGNCGVSAFPMLLSQQKQLELKNTVLSILGSWPKDDEENDLVWTDFASFKETLQRFSPPNDLYFLQGHAALRIAAMEGSANRRAEKKEIEKMCYLLEESLSQGTIGFSTGLYYAPCVYAEEDELEAIMKVLHKHDAIFAIHRREEGNLGYESTLEAVNLASKADVRLQISHLKAIGLKNQKQIEKIIKLIEDSKKNGLDIAFDQYPYTYGSTSFFSLLPPSVLRLGSNVYKEKLKDKDFRKKTEYEIMHPVHFESIIELCGFDNIFVQSSETFEYMDGMSITQIASKYNKPSFDVFFDLISNEKGSFTMKDITQTDEMLELIMSHPLSIWDRCAVCWKILASEKHTVNKGLT